MLRTCVILAGSAWALVLIPDVALAAPALDGASLGWAWELPFIGILLTIGLFLIHIYMSVFAERGAFGSVIRGDVSEEFAKRYHPGWYKEIAGDSSAPRK